MRIYQEREGLPRGNHCIGNGTSEGGGKNRSKDTKNIEKGLRIRVLSLKNQIEKVKEFPSENQLDRIGFFRSATSDNLASMTNIFSGCEKGCLFQVSAYVFFLLLHLSLLSFNLFSYLFKDTLLLTLHCCY